MNAPLFQVGPSAMQRKWVGSADYKLLINALKEVRISAGLSQRELARRLGKPPSFVNKIELLERRLDILEFIAIANALDVPAEALLLKLAAVLPNELRL